MTTPTFTIRAAVPADRPTLVQFMAELQEVERAIQANRTVGAAMADDHLAHLEEVIRTQQGSIFVAERSGELLGFIICLIGMLDEGERHIVEAERRFGYISDLYVRPTARGNGVGTALLQAAEAYFRTLGLTTVQITVLYDNHQARRVYEYNSYTPYELTYKKPLL